LLWAGLICLATLALRFSSLLSPGLVLDDFDILAKSWTWHVTSDNLWTPANEHSMPLGRLSTWLLIRLAGTPERVPRVVLLQGPLALLAATILLYLFVRRETGHPLPALVAMALFGVSARYQEGVIWFAASFAVLAMDMLLLGLLAAQGWRQTRRWWYLVLSAFWCALAPGWFATGILAGPLCALYLLGPDQDHAGPARSRRRLLFLVPLLGTAVSLAITMPRNAERIFNLARTEVEKTAWETFDVGVGLRSTLRALVDDLLPGLAGTSGWTVPTPWVWLALAALLVAGLLWWRAAPRHNLLLLGAGMIGSGYLLVFSGRAYIPYEVMHHWGRYQLYAHLGLVLYLCGAWPYYQGLASRALVPGWRALALMGILYASQAPHGFCLVSHPNEAEFLRRIDAETQRQEH
jgi:hypothetical protein